MQRPRITPWRAAAASLAFLACWKAAHWFALWREWTVAGAIDGWGWVTIFVLGFCWLIWGAERLAQRYESRRGRVSPLSAQPQRPAGRVWNPFDPLAWYYGRRAPRLRQTMALVTGYSAAFFALYLLMHLSPARGSSEPFELPEGGGSDQAGPAPRTVRIQKQVRRKYVINPFSSILFAVPTIDKVELRVGEETRHEYRAGYGEGTGTGGGIGSGSGKGSGFGSGTGRGKVRLPRLKHSDRKWDKNFGIGGDNNMLVQYGVLTNQKVADKTEVIDVGQIGALPPSQAPPLLLVAGADAFQLSAADKKILKQYLLEKSGMILGDNLGGGSFHNQFIQAMREVTGVQEVAIPRDDFIHVRPFVLKGGLPIVVAHGGTTPLGWKVDGRWVAYYHPGALTDAWRDDHAGIKRDVWESCYVLGTNILFYAHLEKNKWLEAQKRR